MDIKPTQFFQNVLIEEIRDIVFRHPYLAFSLIAIGIEFLGKCMLTEYNRWEIKPDAAYKKGMELMTKINTRYSDLDLKDQLRNGFAHTLLPKSKIALSEVRHGAIHFTQIGDKTILVIEILYRDFVNACKLVINTDFDDNDKMNKGFITVNN